MIVEYVEKGEMIVEGAGGPIYTLEESRSMSLNRMDPRRLLQN